MTEKKSKIHIPNANSPELLIRLIEAVARGIRTSRGLQEHLGIELATVHEYVHAGEWLGFLESQGDVWLTPLGLEFAFSGNKQKAVYARAVWSQPFIQECMVGSTHLPTTPELARAIEAKHREWTEDKITAHAKSIRNLIAPGVQRSTQRTKKTRDQLELPLSFVPDIDSQVDLSNIGSQDFEPEIYRYFLAHLIDYGELSLAHVRGLLDAASAKNIPIGGILNMAIERCDAVQVEQRLVVTQGAVARREVTQSTESIILSDPKYRSYLSSLLENKDLTSQPSFSHAEQERLSRWHQRIFGGHKKPGILRKHLEQLLIDRSLDSFPLAGSRGFIPTLSERPFLDVWENDALLIACPPSLKRIQGGLETVNRLFRNAQKGIDQAGIPDLTDRPIYFHGSLLHPGEPPPRNVPDTLSLRLRVLMNAPYIAMTSALLLAQRLDPKGASLRRVSGRWMVHYGSTELGPLLPILDRYAHTRNWIASRRSSGGLESSHLLDILESLQIAASIPSGAVLAERFFARLRTDIEEMEVYRHLRPLAETMMTFLKESQSGTNGRGLFNA